MCNLKKGTLRSLKIISSRILHVHEFMFQLICDSKLKTLLKMNSFSVLRLFSKFELAYIINFKFSEPALTSTAQKLKFSIKDFFSKYDQICHFLRIWSHLVKKSLVENFFLVQCRALLSGSILDLFINFEMSLKKETDAEKVSLREKNHEFFNIKF